MVPSPVATCTSCCGGGDDGGLGLPERIVGERVQGDVAHLVVHAVKAAERVEHAVAPQEVVGGGRQFVAIGAELEVLPRAVIPEITRDDAVLQHPPERDAGAAGRPCQLSRQREIRRQQHRRTGDDGQAALHEPGNRDALAQQRPHDPAGAAQSEKHPERGAVGRGGEGRKGKQQELLGSGNPLAMQRPG